LRRAKGQGVTVVVVTQRPALLQSVDKVLILRGGRVAAFGPPECILQPAGDAPQSGGRVAAGSPVKPKAGRRPARAQRGPNGTAGAKRNS
jgi:ATP-binding cassette subfamily C protein